MPTSLPLSAKPPTCDWTSLHTFVTGPAAEPAAAEPESAASPSKHVTQPTTRTAAPSTASATKPTKPAPYAAAAASFTQCCNEI